MAKMEALIAGQRYKLESSAEIEAMQEVIAETNARLDEIRSSQLGIGQRELFVLSLLEAVAELGDLQARLQAEIASSEDKQAAAALSEIAALQSRVQFLEAALDFAQQSTVAKQQQTVRKRRDKEKTSPKRKKSSRGIDFAERQPELAGLTDVLLSGGKERWAGEIKDDTKT